MRRLAGVVENPPSPSRDISADDETNEEEGQPWEEAPVPTHPRNSEAFVRRLEPVLADVSIRECGEREHRCLPEYRC